MSAKASCYIPTGSSSSSIIQNLNDYVASELALPGNWSSKLFYKDLKESPVLSKRILSESLENANINPVSYLIFFGQTRGYSKNVSKIHAEIYSLFEQGSIMLYFEDYFLRLVEKDKSNSYDEIILKYIEVLSSQSIGLWDEIVAGIGACCYQFFAQEPELYAKLAYRKQTDCPENMTDFELLNIVAKGQFSLSPNKYPNKISIQDSRSELIQLYQNVSK